MTRILSIRTACSMACCCLLLATAAVADEIGRIKVARGEVSVDRGGVAIAAAPGVPVHAADVVRTGADGSVGITMADGSLLSAGPNSLLSLDHFAFDATTQKGRFDASLKRGTLSVVSGAIAKQSPDGMTIRTPATMLGVRGTEFVVSVDAPLP